MSPDEDLLAAVRGRLATGRRVRRSLAPEGRLHVDRQLPFLVVYRRPPGRADAGTARLVTSAAAYLCASGERGAHRALAPLVRAVVDVQRAAFGGFLLLELWAAPGRAGEGPSFRILAPRAFADDPTVRELAGRLGQVRVHRRGADVEVVPTARTGPAGLPGWLKGQKAQDGGVVALGLEVAPVWRAAGSGERFPLVLSAVARQVARALNRCFFEFARTHTTHHPPHYHALGRRALVRAAWQVDGELAAVADAFDLLLLCTPVDADRAWDRFRRRRHGEEPTFRYRPLPLDPALLKRRLFAIPVERIEDPQLERIFRQKQAELDRQLTLLSDRSTPRFRASSTALYGDVDPALLALAERLLRRIPRKAPRGAARREALDAEDFAARARGELRAYRRAHADVRTRVEVRDDLPAGLMVSRGRLLIGAGSRMPAARADALLQHEVGTHLLTWYNGRSQPLKLLASGLAGYEELQEGVAVLAEHLVGGLSAARLRLLAARVVAARSVIDGASFVDTFRLLTRRHGLEGRPAFGVAMRVHRGGGLTKDAIYLRGLQAVLHYLAEGGDLEILLLGKIALEHAGVIEELLHRKVLHPPPLRPRYLERPDAQERLSRLRAGTSVEELLQ